MTKSLRGHYRGLGRNDWRDKSVIVPAWRCAAECSIVGKRLPKKLSRHTVLKRRVRQATIDDDEAERRRWRASTSDDWWNVSSRYGGAVQCRHAYTRTASLNSIRFGTFGKCNCARSGVMQSYIDAKKHKPSSRIQHRLHPLGEMGWNARQHCVTVVQPLQNERRHQWL